MSQTEAAGTNQVAKISAAKGEYESFQIVVRAPASGLSNVNVTVSDLVGPGGAVISKDNFTLYREHYVNVNTSSPDWGGSNRPLPTGWYADGLIPFVHPDTKQPLSGATLTAVPFNLTATRNQPIWVDLLVPRTAAAGAYTGSYTVTSAQGSYTGQIELTVWNFTLPLQPSAQSSFLVWTADYASSVKELLRNRLMPLRTNPSDQPTLMSSYGLSSQNLGYWSGADINNCSMSPAPSVTQFQQTAAQQASGLKLYNYSADEIGHCSSLYPTIKQWAANMHQAGTKNLITMAPIPELYDDGTSSGKSAVDIWVILPVMHEGSRARVTEVLGKGDEVWSYNTLVQDAYSPKWLIDFRPIEFRIQPGFINQTQNLNGILYWKVDQWSSDPWNNVYTSAFYNYPGEGLLLYPGSTVGYTGVAPSIRLKWLRDGIEDYEYVEMLKKAGQSDWALQLSRGIAPDWYNWTRDNNALESTRTQLGVKLDTLGGGSGGGGTTTPAPGAVGTPSPADAATAVGTSTVLSWAASSNAVSYDVYFGTSATPVFVKNTTTLNHNPGTLLSNTKYYWRIVAKNATGSTASAVWSFTTAGASAPAAVIEASPAPGATGVSTSPTLSWTAPEGATSYDVYLGLTATPAFLGTTTNTTISGGTLLSGNGYYWKIVAKNSAGATSSAVWQFTTAASTGSDAPVPVSMVPTSGSGSVQNFQFTYSVPKRFASAYVLFGSNIDGRFSCWFSYDKAAGRLWLAKDNLGNWDSVLLGSGGVLENNQCSLSASDASLVENGGQAVLSVTVQFKPTFTGTKKVFTQVADAVGTLSEFVQLGSWQVRK